MKNLRKNTISGIYESDYGLSPVSLHFTEWWNGEGMDFTFDEKKHISLHIDELHAMMVSALASGMLDIGDVMENVAEMKRESKEREEAVEAIRKNYQL